MPDSITNQEPQEEIACNVDVPKAIWLRAKSIAVLREKSMKQFVAEALERYTRELEE